MLPVLDREVVEAEQGVAILDQALNRLVVFDAPGLDEGVEGGKPIVLVSTIQVSCSARLAFGCWLFGSLLRTLAILCTRGPLKKAPMPDSVLVNDSTGARYARMQGAGSAGALYHRAAPCTTAA